MIITILRKPLEGTVADNTLKHGCGAINIDATRVGYSDSETIDFTAQQRQQADPKEKGWSGHVAQVGTEIQMHKEKGRWPANFILIHKESCELTGTKKVKSNGHWTQKANIGKFYEGGWSHQEIDEGNKMSDDQGKEIVSDWDCAEGCPVKNIDQQSNGDTSRFFKQFKKGNNLVKYLKLMITPPIENPVVEITPPYDFMADEESVHGLILLGEPTDEEAKVIFESLKSGAHVVMIPKKESIGYEGVIALEDIGFEVRDSIFVGGQGSDFYYATKASRTEREVGLNGGSNGRVNIHPTVKPIEIMEWCARDIQPNSKVVDPFLGSGTTGIAMSRLGHDFVGVELNPEYAKIATSRIEYWSPIGAEIKSEAVTDKKKEDYSLF